MNEEGESLLHTRRGGSLDMGAEYWRLGILAGMGISEATCTGIATMDSLGSLGYAQPRLGSLGMLGKDLAISQNPRGGKERTRR